MSNSIDQRIVEMQFDNSSFEKGVASTMASLESLDKVLGGTKSYEALKNVTSTLDTSYAAAQVSGLSAALDSVADRAESSFSKVTGALSSLGKGVGIVTGLINTGIGAIAIQGGLSRAMDLSEAKFKLHQLGYEWEDVGGIIQESVNDTAYGLGEAAVAAAGLAASGVTAENGLADTLRATANLASVSGMEYSRVAQLMGQVASQGKLMGMQLESFQLAGINVAGILAEQWGISEAAVHEMVKKGQIDLEMFRDAMNEKLGDGAKDAQQTFTGSLANVRAALSRSTADLFETGMTSLVPLFNAWRDSINEVNKALNPLMRTWTDAEGVFKEGVLIRGFRNVTAAIAEAFTEWAKESTGPENLARVIQELSDGLEGFFDAVAGGAKDFTYSILDVMGIIRELVRIFGELVSPVFMALNDVFGGNEFGNAMAAVRGGLEGILEALVGFKVGDGYINVVRTAFALFFNVINTAGKIAATVIGAIVKVAGTLGSIAVDAFFWLFEVLNDIGTVLVGVLSSLGGDLFGPLFASLSEIPILSSFANLLGKIPEGLERITAALRGEDGAFEKLTEFFKSLDETGAGVLSGLGDAFGHLGEKLFEFGSGFKVSAMDVAGKAMERFGQIAEKLKPILAKIGETLAAAWNAIVESFQASGFSFDPFINLFGSFGDAFTNFLDTLLLGDGLSFDAIVELFSGLKDGIGEFLSGMGEPLLEFLGDLGGKIADNLGGPFAAFYDWLTSLQDPLGSITGNLKDLSDSVGDTAKSLKLPWLNEDAVDDANAFSDAVDKSYDALTVFDTIVEAIKHPAETAGKVVSTFLKTIGDSINEFVDNLEVEGLGKVLDTLGHLAILGGVVVALKETLGFMDAAKEFLKGASEFLHGLNGVFSGLTGTLKSISMNLKVNAILQIAAAIAILVASLYAISKIDTERLEPSMQALVSIILIMAFVFAVLSAIPETSVASATVLSAAMRSLAVSVALMAVVAALLGQLDPAQLQQGLQAVVIMAAVIAGLAVVCSMAKGLSAAGSALLEMAAALAILVVISAYLTNNMDNVIPGALMVLAMLAVLLLVAKALDKLGGVKMTGAEQLVVMAAAVAIIGLVVAALAKVASGDIEAAWHAVGMIAALLAELTIIMLVMDHFASNEGTFLAAATSLVVMAAALLIIAGAMAGLAFVASIVDITPAFIAIALMMGVMAAAIVGLSNVGPQATVAASALITVAIAMALMAAMLAVLSTMDLEAVGISLAIVAAAVLVAVVAFAAFAAIAEVFKVGVVAMTLFALSLGVLAFGIAAAVNAIVNALESMANTGPEAVDSFIQSLSQLGRGLWDIRGDIGLGIAALGSAVIEGILMMIPGAVSAVIEFIVSLAQAFVANVGPLIEAGVQGIILFIDGLATALHDNGEALGQALMQLGVTILEGVISIIFNGLAMLVDGLASIVGEITGETPEWGAAVRSMGDELVNGLEESMNGMDTAALDKVRKTAEGIRNESGNMRSAGSELGQAATDGLDSATAGAADTVKFNVANIPGVVGDMMSQAQSMLTGEFDTSELTAQFEEAGVQIPEIGAMAGEGFGANLQESVAAVDISDTLMSDIDSGAISEKLSQAGVDAAEGFNSGFHDSLHVDGEALDISALSDSSGFSEAATTCAEAYTDSLSSGLQQASSAASNAASNAVNALRSGGSGGYSAGYSVGYQMSSGVASGLWAGYGSVAAAAESIISKVNEVMRAKAEINSPSKMTARIGDSLAEGIAFGLARSERDTTRSAGSFMTSVLRAMKDDYVDALMGDIDENPTIRPVLDLEEYAAGIAMMSAMMPTDQYMMAGRIMGNSAASSPFSSSTNNHAVYEINLNYTKDADANQMVEDITRELHSKNLMEAH